MIKKINIYILFSFFLFSCTDTGNMTWEAETKTYPSDYKMIEVPVPQGGITFPIGYDDDKTTTINNAFYLGETEVYFALYEQVAEWATNEKPGKKYTNIYFNKYPYTPKDRNYPKSGATYLEILVWCNAYTEWYNAQYGANLTPVYTEISGEPIRNAHAQNLMSAEWVDIGNGMSMHVSNVENGFAYYYKYIEYHKTMENYLLNIDTSGTGFRLPTPDEWELAARWRGDDSTNSVTETINGIDFSSKPIKFTKGNSASGAAFYAMNLDETNQYAVFEYNTKNLKPSKTKKPNKLGFYDMSGNLREYVYHVEYVEIPSQYDVWGSVTAKDYYPFAQTRGGFYEDINEPLSIGASIYVDATAYNYYYGFRVARNK